MKDKPIIQRFHWTCDDCRLSGHVDIELPRQVRNLHGMLEDDHAKKRGPKCCPSDYFQITNITFRSRISLRLKSSQKENRV